MEQQQLNYYKNRLEELRKNEKERAERIAGGLRTSLQDSIDELSLYDNHPADIGNETFEREKDLGFKLFAEDRLAMIAEALDCIEKGTYGQCEACGQDIGSDRLEVIPYTTLCLKCKNAHEGLERHPRPIEEDMIQPPFGGNYRTDENMFDGEDAWQAVARYGTSDSPSDIGSVADYDDVYLNPYEDQGLVEEYEGIPARKGKDGQIYKDFGGDDDENSPRNMANK